MLSRSLSLKFSKITDMITTMASGHNDTYKTGFLFFFFLYRLSRFRRPTRKKKKLNDIYKLFARTPTHIYII